MLFCTILLTKVFTRCLVLTTLVENIFFSVQQNNSLLSNSVAVEFNKFCSEDVKHFRTITVSI